MRWSRQIIESNVGSGPLRLGDIGIWWTLAHEHM